MNYDDEQRLAADGATEVMYMGSGKTQSASLAAYWYLMQKPVAGEEEPGGAVGERFTPVPVEELKRRLAVLHERAVEPLTEEIEELSDSGRFLASDEETQESGEGTEEAGPSSNWAAQQAELRNEIRKEIYTQGAPNLPIAAWKRYAGDHYSDYWEETRRSFSTVLLVGRALGRGMTPKKRRHSREIMPLWLNSEHMLIDRRFEWPRLLESLECRRPANFWDAWDTERERAAAEHRMEELRTSSCSLQSLDYERLREAVRTYLTLRTSVTVVVGAARNPDAALTSLIADATSFGTAETADGTWSLLVAAPPVAAGLCHEAGRPRLAVMELPGAPPGPNELWSDTNTDGNSILRRLIDALTAL
ncbi:MULTISPECIES: hypothetical protein [unclassified Streptomyces]|uniref:hypothetical protein n=1 Tax=unclassified Streptomyces TaxID=2593676 RepID=UPI000B0823D8|nr:hypothetical protein [Streptomyces sp. Root1310]